MTAALLASSPVRALAAHTAPLVVVAASADPSRVEAIRWTGYAFIAFGVLYLAYRWFRDR